MGKEEDLLDACRSGHQAIVDKILSGRLKKRGPLNLTSLRRLPGANTADPRNGLTCLHYASLNGHKSIVRLLLEHGANPNVVDHNGSPPLHLAAWTGDYEIVELLANIANNHQRTDINLANKDNETALHSACQYGHRAVVSLLLAKGGDPRIRNVRGETPLDLAAQYGRFETVEMLVNVRFELLEEFSTNRRIDGSSHLPTHSPLHLASRNGHKTIVKLLLEMGFDVNYLTRNGTALHEAVLCGKVEVVRLLLQAGVDIYLENEHGQKVDELLSGVNTPIAKETLKLLHDYARHGRAAIGTSSAAGGAASSLSRSLISPMSEMDLSTTTLHASNSFCDQEDLTLVDSMLNEEVALYAHDFDDEIVGDEQQPVHCISPPPGYTDNPLVDGGETSTGQQVDLAGGSSNPCYVPSPTSSLFSASIFSELASIFEKDFQNRISGDDRTSYESSEDLAGMKSVKPSTSFTSSDFGGAAGSPMFTHHKSFDAMWRPKGDEQGGGSSSRSISGQQPQPTTMSSSLNSGCISDYGGEMEEERYRYSVSNAELLQMSNYSISSSSSNVMQQQQPATSAQPYRPPPKPPRKSLKARSIDYGGGHLEPAKSDFNVNYTQKQKKDRDKASKEETKTNETEEGDSEEGSNSQQLNSVISKETKKKAKEENGDKNRNISTLAMSFDDFYKLYDQIASNATNSPIKSVQRGTKSIDLDYEHRIAAQNKENTTPPPGADMAEEDVVTVIEALKAKYAEIQPPKRRKRKKRSSTEPASARLSTNELLNNKRDSSTATADAEVIIVADKGDGITSGGALVEPVRPVRVGVVEKRSVAIETERRRPKPTVVDRMEMNGGGGGGGGVKKKSELYSSYCETLKFDRKGEKGNPFAGLCRGGLTPKKKPQQPQQQQQQQQKQLPTSQSSLSMSSDTKKKMVHLNETRKSLRRQRSLLSGRAESLTKLDSPTTMGGSSRLSVYNGSDSRSVTGGDYDIYAPLRRKKKSRSLNGETHLLEVYGQELSIDGKGETETPEDRLLPWLRRIHMHQYKELLVSNGYDDLNFMDQAVMDDSDLLAIGIINAAHRETLLKAAAQLPTPSWRLTKAELNSMSVDDWLTRLHLTEYGQAFRKHEVSELKKIRNIWEVELETMLDIDKVGHRRRIMNSFAEFSRESMLMDDDGISSWLSDATSNNGAARNASPTKAESKSTKQSDAEGWKVWKHARQELTTGACVYSVCYLGSTLVRELRGIDSTRASIGKLKLAAEHLEKEPNILLVISCKGVQFKDNHSSKLVCEHEIRNIHCICQDSEDLTYFAYITKDFESNQHYCHVFMSPHTDLVNEIILTLGQAFEIAYQIVLEQFNMHAAAMASANAMSTSGSMQTSSGSEAVGGGLPEMMQIAPPGMLSIKYKTPVNLKQETEEVGEKQSKPTIESKPSEGQVLQTSKYYHPNVSQQPQLSSRDEREQHQMLQSKREANERVLQSQAKKPVEDIYAVVDRSKKARFNNKQPPAVSSACAPTASSVPVESTAAAAAATDTPPPLTSRTSSLKSRREPFSVRSVQSVPSPGSSPSPNEDIRPTPPRRSSSSAASSAANTPNSTLEIKRLEIKPKPPMRVASMSSAVKPEVSPKPKNLLLKPGASPVPPPLPVHSTNSLHHSSTGGPGAAKPVIAAKPAAVAGIRRANTNPRQLSYAQWSAFGGGGGGGDGVSK